MQIIADVRTCEVDFSNLILTVGSFDGIHKGHQKILEALVTRAHEQQGTAALMTLKPHPREYFSPGNAPNILTSEAKKRQLLEAAGIDVLFYLPFDARVAEMERRAFLEEIVIRRCGAKGMIIGHDFAFGKDASGNTDYLHAVGPALGLTVEEVSPVYIAGERVSSTLIRESILQGELDRVALFLGRPYSIFGEVISGRGIGRTLGFPTANIMPHNNAVPANGVYVAHTLVDGRTYPVAVNIGVAPTLKNEDIVIEAHLLDYSGDLTGKTLELLFCKRLRPEKKFHDMEALKGAIQADIAAVRQYFQ